MEKRSISLKPHRRRGNAALGTGLVASRGGSCLSAAPNFRWSEPAVPVPVRGLAALAPSVCLGERSIRRARCSAFERLDPGGVAVPPSLGLALGGFGRSSRSTSAYLLEPGRLGEDPISETDGGRRPAARQCGEWAAARWRRLILGATNLVEGAVAVSSVSASRGRHTDGMHLTDTNGPTHCW